MSMLSEQIEEIKACAYAHEASGDAIYGTALTLYQAAETIEALSAKLVAENMERSDRYYGGGWIACADRLPDKSGSYLVTTYSTGISAYISDVDQFVHNGMPDGYWINGEDVIAWQPLPEPYRP